MKYYLYDFDGTIYDGDSGVDIFFYAIRKYPKILRRIPGMLFYCLKYLLKLCSKEEAKSKIFSFVQDIPDIDQFVLDFWKGHEKKLKKFWTEKESHKKDVIISASARFWLEWVADKYEVHDLFASEIDKRTGELKVKNCHGKQKVKLFYEKYPKAIIQEMYTDSVHDLPLIEEAKEGFLVKKNKIYKYYDYKPNILVRFWRWGWGVYHKNEELWNYLIIGFLTMLVNIFVKWILLFTLFDADNGCQLQIAIVISWICAVIFAYVTNRIIVFKSKNKNILKEAIHFFEARILTLIMEMLIMWFFITFLGLNSNGWVISWTILTQVLIIIFNYIFSKLFVFKKN